MAVETIKTQNNPSVHFDINMISIQVRQWIRKTMKYRNSNNKLMKIINQKFFHKLSSIFFFFFVSVMATEVFFYDLTKEVTSTSGLLLSKSDLFVWLCGCVRVCGVHPLHPQCPQEVAVESVDQIGHAERDSMGHFFGHSIVPCASGLGQLLMSLDEHPFANSIHFFYLYTFYKKKCL